ncbi:MAG: LamG-like jellyroll fold domain-containing protein [Bacteroidales bacterium]
MRQACLFLLIALALNDTASAQNRSAFFKTLPQQEPEMPEWARLMYGDDPNIKQVDFEYDKYYASHPFEKTVHTQNYRHWRRFADEWMNPEGFIRLPGPLEEEALLRKMEARVRVKSGRPGSWTPIGPFATYAANDQPDLTVSWQANVYCLDQADSRPEILFAGTEAGGLFKSIDKGLTWSLVTASVPVVTINDVKISAKNPDLVYFASDKRIYRSDNGGGTWSVSYVVGDEIFQLLIDPVDDSKAFCAAANGLFRTTDGGVSWERLIQGKCWDIKFHPSDRQILYLTRNNAAAKRCELFKSTDGGGTFTIRESGWYVPAAPASATDQGAKIAVTPAAPDLVYVALIGESKAGDNGWIGLYRSNDAGESWVNPNPPDGGPYSTNRQNPASFNPDGTGFHQGFYDFALDVSHQDPNKLWLGTINFLRSTNGGASWTRIGSYYAQQDIGWIHPDIQDIHVRGNEIFVSSDGGINYSTDELRSHETRNYGLAGSDYWGFGQGWNEDVLVGGRYHNGNSGYLASYGTGNSLRLGGAEAPTGYVNPMESRKAYFSDINSVILPETLDGEVIYFSKLGMYPTESYTESYSSEMEWDPRYSGHLYLGESGKIWKSTNGGGYFETLYNFGTGKVLEIEVCRSNPEVIWCVFQPKGGYWDPCSLRRSTDGGKTWTATAVVPTNDRWRLEITSNPMDENELWVIAVNAGNGRKVYRTTDGGKSWEARNSDLFNDERPLDIQFQGGTEGVVYLATSAGVYLYDPASENWSEFMDGLPAWTRAMEMKPFYAGNKLRLATGGRGIWETDLALPSKPLAQPMTVTDTVFNPADTVRFESHSIIRADGATWSWAFSPEPDYVSSLTARNPRVVFGREGSYDVMLTVTDRDGFTDTRAVSRMVTVVGRPEPDPKAGLALECKVTGDFAVTGDLGIETKVLTITAWVKPDGLQPDYTGIVISNGEAAGFNFRGGNNTLGYHWPGGAWYWDSKLIVPSGRWSHVAMVADGSSVTLYVNGIPSRHVISLQTARIATMDIGSYMGWSSRNYKGLIDEVCIWERALSMQEIRENQHLTREHYRDDPTFKAYYQFNETGGIVFNRVGSTNGNLNGGAARTRSSAPVGSGTSSRLAVHTGGTYSFPETGLTLGFPPNAPLYPGDGLVVTRLAGDPSDRPNGNPGLDCYWIINSFENDHFISTNQVRLLPLQGSPTDTLIAAPGQALLFTRPVDEAAGGWERGCSAAEVLAGEPGTFVFASECGIAGPLQLCVVSDAPSVNLLKGLNTLVEGRDYPGRPGGLKIYPNPAEQGTGIRLSVSGSGPARIRMVDASGRVVYDRTDLKPGESIIQTGKLAPGFYTIWVIGERYMESGGVIIK